MTGRFPEYYSFDFHDRAPERREDGRPARRLTPVLNVDGEDFLVMTHEMASVRQSQLGEEVVSVREHRQAIKNALDFLLDGF